MKEVTLLTWVTQLGLSVALPLAGFIFLALWLRSQFGCSVIENTLQTVQEKAGRYTAPGFV